MSNYVDNSVQESYYKDIRGKKKESSELLAYLAEFSMWYPHKTVTKSSSCHPTCFAASQLHPRTSKGTCVACVFTGRESLAGKRSCLLRQERACMTLVLQGTLRDCWKFSAPCRVGHARQDFCPWRSRAASVWSLLGACWEQQPIYSLHQCFL